VFIASGVIVYESVVPLSSVVDALSVESQMKVALQSAIVVPGIGVDMVLIMYSTKENLLFKPQASPVLSVVIVTEYFAGVSPAMNVGTPVLVVVTAKN